MMMVAGLFLLAVVSGSVGLGVAFAAVPFLSLFLPDVVHQVQPLTLLLNGVTTVFAAAGFAHSGYVDGRKAAALAPVLVLLMPAGAWLAHFVTETVILSVYFAAVVYLLVTLLRPVRARPGDGDAVPRANVRRAMVWTAPIAVLSGFLGIGPGFLLVPALILLGFEPKRAAGVNALAAAPASFAALVPHLGTAVWDPSLTLVLLAAGVAGAFTGARLSSALLPPKAMRWLFGSMIVGVSAYKLYTLAA